MVVRISDKTQNYSKVTKLLVKPFFIYCEMILNIVNNVIPKEEYQYREETMKQILDIICYDLEALNCKICTKSNGKLIIVQKDASVTEVVDIVEPSLADSILEYNYDLKTTDFTTFPVNMENGTYTIKILQQIEGTRYAICASTSMEVNLTNDLAPYLYPNQIVDYTIDSYVYKKSFELVKEDRDDLTRIAHLFKYVVDTLDYDDQKAKDVSETFVLPDIDGSLKSHKGICFDYAASLAALCRIQGIPAKVIVGWTDIEYHAWVEIYLKDKGWINPKIYFKKEKWNLVDPTFSDSKNSDYEGKYDEVYHY